MKTFNEIKEIISNTISEGRDDLLIRSSRRYYIDLRMVFIYMARQDGYTNTDISQYLGISRCAVIYHFSKFYDLYRYNIPFRKLFDKTGNTVTMRVITAKELKVGDRFYKVSDRSKKIFQVFDEDMNIIESEILLKKIESSHKDYLRKMNLFEKVVFLRNANDK